MQEEIDGHVQECPCHTPLEPREHPALHSSQKLIKGFLQHANCSNPPQVHVASISGLDNKPGAEPLQWVSTACCAAVVGAAPGHG